MRRGITFKIYENVYNIHMNLKDLINHENMWVAYSKDRKHIVTKSKSLEDLLKKIKANKDLIVSFIPPSDITVSP